MNTLFEIAAAAFARARRTKNGGWVDDDDDMCVEGQEGLCKCVCK